MGLRSQKRRDRRRRAYAFAKIQPAIRNADYIQDAFKDWVDANTNKLKLIHKELRLDIEKQI